MIIYGTTEGQTRKIARFLEAEADAHGHQATQSNANEEPPTPEEFDAVIVAASVHMHEYQGTIKHYIREHKDVLTQKRSAFISVSLTAASDEPESWRELEGITEEFLDDLGWEPNYVEQVAGALRYSKYSFLKTFVMRLIAQKTGRPTYTSDDYEFTDWDKLKEWLRQFLA